MYYGPLASVQYFIKSRSPDGLPLNPLIMQLVACILWTIWAVYIKEIPAIIPNGLGVIFSVAEILLWVWLYQQKKKDEAANGLSSTPTIVNKFKPLALDPALPDIVETNKVIDDVEAMKPGEQPSLQPRLSFQELEEMRTSRNSFSTSYPLANVNEEEQQAFVID